jgi:hypothetical protein
LCNPGSVFWTLTCFLASAAVNWFDNKVFKFKAALRNPWCDARLDQALDVMLQLLASMKIVKYLTLVAFILNILSCVGFDVGSYDFVTTAVYIAPKSNAKAFVLTRGYVPKDADLADNFELMEVKFVFEDSKRDSLTIRQKGENDYEVQMAFEKKVLKYFELQDDITEYLSMKCEADEARELANAIFSTIAGPKGTYMKGQAKSIFVDTVYFTTKNR